MVRLRRHVFRHPGTTASAWTGVTRSTIRRFGAAVLLFSSIAAAEPVPPPEDPASLYAPHGEIGAFFNPWAPFPHRWTNLLWWFLTPNPFDKSGAPVLPVVPNDGSSFSGRESSASVTWIGHATVAVHDEADVFLTDPHWGKRALVVSRHTPPGVPLEAIPADAFAIVSHNHYDHLDSETIERLPASMSWYVPLGLAAWVRDHGPERVVELDWWQSARHGRWTITCLPAQHWSRRIGQGTNETLWCSWLVDSGARRYFHAGDSGYFHGYREFGRRFGPIDVAFLPIGAFEPRGFMRYQHMNPTDAILAARDLRAKDWIAIHWGAFDLANEPLDYPPKALATAMDEVGADASRAHVLAVGERWRVP